MRVSHSPRWSGSDPSILRGERDDDEDVQDWKRKKESCQRIQDPKWAMDRRGRPCGIHRYHFAVALWFPAFRRALSFGSTSKPTGELPSMSSRKLEILPKGWSMQQCAKCYMVFALPQLKGDSSRVLANARITKELTRHVRESHSNRKELAGQRSSGQ